MKQDSSLSGIRRWIILLSGILAILSTLSCSPMVRLGDSTGIAAYSYSLGALKVLYKTGLMETWDASLAALKENNLTLQDSAHGQSTGRIVAKGGDGRIVTLSLEYKAQRETEAVIRAGYAGDRELSVKIAEAVRRVLFDG